ncbi:MAG TPA: hypothetical protein VIM89_16340 [Mucilaginibacter sp.]
MNNFSISRQITLKDYRQLSFNLTYKRWWVILINALALVFIVLLIITKGKILNDNDFSSIGVALIFMAIWFPIGIFLAVRRNFKSNYRLHEFITYNLSEDGFSVTGESFNSTMDWTKVYKIRIIEGWLLIYSNRIVANLIKIGPDDQGNIEALKSFLKNGHFKAKLKW